MKPGVTTTVIIIAVCGACTFLERALPFIIFRGREIPKVIKYLGKVLPMAIMATLIAYCLRGADFKVPVNWMPQIIAALVTAGLHIWKKNAMLSIFLGTACCMVLSHLV
ncbi:MAG: AzlD domain-containing protein [Lachnospiraceae bacterium]|nr:AzlD domain-containing protein [Lachnospiraceae bacterium]